MRWHRFLGLFLTGVVAFLTLMVTAPALASDHGSSPVAASAVPTCEKAKANQKRAKSALVRAQKAHSKAKAQIKNSKGKARTKARKKLGKVKKQIKKVRKGLVNAKRKVKKVCSKADTSPVRAEAEAVNLAVGSSASVVLPNPLLGVTALSTPSALPSGVSVVLKDGAVRLSASMSAVPFTDSIALTGIGCTRRGCRHPLTLQVPVTVRTLDAPAGTLNSFTEASLDRVTGGTPIEGGGILLTDELVITLGTPDNPGTREQAEAIAASVGGTISGGIDAIGVYELRWMTPQDLAARTAELLGMANVTDVSQSPVGIVSSDAIPNDWSDDGPEGKWTYLVTGAPRAWDISKGSNVKVGIIDMGQVFGGHPDLNVVQKIGGDGVGEHATHVAGTACARQNNQGVVGFAWGCPIVTSGIGNGSPKQVLAVANAVVGAGVRVVNMSIGYNTDGCASNQSQQDELLASAGQWKQAFRQLFRGPVGRDVVWATSAGNNCAAGVPSPWGLNSDLGNVISVAASNSDGNLASFSDFGKGVEVAAPGGVGVGRYGNGATGIWSTTVTKCLIFFRCASYGTTIDGGIAVGTSMASPAVAGIAALVRSKYPNYGASRAAGCVVGNAVGSGTVTQRSLLPSVRVAKVPFTGSIPIVNAEQAVRCPSLTFSSGPGTGPPPTSLGGYPMSAFGRDSQSMDATVDGVNGPTGRIGFSPSLEHREVPFSWSTWSHGYEGDVYFTGESGGRESKVAITLPTGTSAFSFYAEPNTFDGFTVEAIADDGTSSEPIQVQGEAGARYFGFYGANGRKVAAIEVSASDPQGFAVGEFMIAP